MAICNKQGFGVYLTDDFGAPFKKLNDLAAKCKEHQSQGEKEGWLFSCPSAEDDQLVLGAKVELTKNTDFHYLEQHWREILATAPKEIQDAYQEVGAPEPDICFLSGHY